MDQAQAQDKLLHLGISQTAATKTLSLLAADGVGQELLEQRVGWLIRLAQASGNLQSAKLAYSLAGRSGLELSDQNCGSLVEALRCSDCVPAAVRLWKSAFAEGLTDPLCLSTAARLGDNSATQFRVLKKLKSEPSRLASVAELARRLHAVAWEADGSWGYSVDPQGKKIWWDHAIPREYKPYGMTLTSQAIDLKNKLGAQFCFHAKWDIQGSTDRGHLEISLDGRRWERKQKFEGSADWEKHHLDLSEFQGQDVWIRFHILSGGNREGCGLKISEPSLEFHPVDRRSPIVFTDIGNGWKNLGDTASQAMSLYGGESESTLTSDEFYLAELAQATLTFRAKMVATSIYSETKVEVIDQDSQIVGGLTDLSNPEWKDFSLKMPLSSSGPLRIRLWSRFAKRNEQDGFCLKELCLKAASSAEVKVVPLDGGFEDGRKEREALLQLLESGTVEELETLARLRETVPNLRIALALNSLLENEIQIPALVRLFSELSEEAVHAFKLLRELAIDEELLLQASVLLTAGLENYLSTRDYLGDGLLSDSEFEENCQLYLKLRERWSEAEAREGLSLLLTPVGAEEFSDRQSLFQSLLCKQTSAQDFFQSWDRHWQN